MNEDANQNPDPSPEPTRAESRGRWGDRTLGLRAVAAVWVAALLLGGGAGALIGYAAHADSPDGPRYSRIGDPGGTDGHGFAPPGGQLPPGTAPETERDEGSDT